MISGRRYVSSARAAKEHGYHSDYIGQLIRGGKVRGQKVGRAWYVDAESLAVYLGKEISEAVAERAAEEKKEEITAKEEISLEPQPEVVSHLEVPAGPVVEEKIEEEEYRIPISKIVESRREFVSELEVSPVMQQKNSGLRYISDDESLLPEIRKNKSISRELDDVTPIITEDPAEIQIEESSRRQSYVKQGFALAGLGTLVLVVVTAASSLFVFNFSVGSTQTASVQFSLPQ